jgi:hypothetical protein
MIWKDEVQRQVGPGEGMTAVRANTDSPPASLRAWLDRLAARDRLALARCGVALRFELAAIVKYFEGRKALLVPKPEGHKVPVVSGIVAARAWIAEATGVEPAGVLRGFEAAALNPLPSRRVDSAPVQAVVHDTVASPGRCRPITNWIAGPTSPPGRSSPATPRPGRRMSRSCAAR